MSKEPQSAQPEAADPYDADSDKEYAPLEADRIPAPPAGGESPRDIIDEAVDANLFSEDNSDDPEDAYPSRNATGQQETQLREMLRESINRDPETLAAELARRRSADPESMLTREARTALDRAPEMPDDTFDTEDVENLIEDLEA